MATIQSDISLGDYMAWEEITFDWARAFDTKDWNLLHSILAPKFSLDYTEVYGFKDDNMTPEAYVAMCNSADMLGDRGVKTQHLLAGSKVRKLSSTKATAWRQIRVGHVKFDIVTAQQTAKAHGYGVVQFFYEKVDDSQWKLCGVKTYSDFFEGNIRSVFPTFPEIGMDF